MRKTTNAVTLQGKLYAHTLEHKTSKKGVNYIGGTIDLQTDDAGLNIVTVNYLYVAPTYPAKGDKPERPNPNYATLEKLINSGKTVMMDGADAATLLKLTPSLAVNDFPDRDGKMVAAKRLEGGFVSVIPSLPEKASDRNEFKADIIISGANVIEPDDGEPYMVLKGHFFNFTGAMAPADFVVKSAGGMKYFESLDISKGNPVFTKVWGPIQSETITRRVEEESAFGEPSIKEYTKTTRNWVVIGAAPETYPIDDAEEGITKEEITKAIQDRELHLADVKKQSEEYQATKNAAAPAPVATAAPAAGGFLGF